MPPAPPPATQESYHTQHSPFGAFASFTLGLVDAPGGFGHALRGPARQNLYIGFRPSPSADWHLLPYFTPPQSNESAFTGELSVAQPPKNYRSLRPGDYTRTLNWATDTWQAHDNRFTFSLLTPFSRVPDPAKLRGEQARLLLAPVVCGFIEFDNRTGKTPAELIFGLGEPDRGLHPLSDDASPHAGFACGTEFAYATKPARDIELRQGFDVFTPKFRDHRGLLVIGGETALVFTVPAGKKKRFPLVLAFYNAGQITTGLPASYAYTRHFSSLTDVLAHGLAHHTNYTRLARTRDAELDRSKLNPDQRFLLAQATHSYLGNTQLLWHRGNPLWNVNEGEYRMMNTFDLTVDHLFFELEWQPWAVRDTLDLFVRRYAYTDRIRLSDRLAPGGLAFTHDMGVMNHFTPPGRSSYECDGVEGCFSHMTMEQLLNWILAAVTYAEKTGDRAWLRRHKKTLLACAESLRRRDDPDPKKRDGILKHDSARTGTHGWEITTYDSLDVSLGQARNNLYLAVKTLGAWVLLENAFARLGLKKDSAAARATASLLTNSITQKFEPDTGFFPAVFEKGNQSRILPAVEGFLYPLYLGYRDAIDPAGRFAPLFDQLRQHLAQSFRRGVCLDEISGAWKMSSTSRNTWFSKIALAQHVIRKLFPETLSDDARAADRVHADWQRRPGCGAFAMCDQILSDTGTVCGSRYYPRGVTAYLWLLE
jgi:hypothetical protein